eukprot:sb/3477321/
MMAGDQQESETSPSETPTSVVKTAVNSVKEGVKTAAVEEVVKTVVDTEHDSLITYPTFENPWDFSDLILNLDDRKFHVHKVSQSGKGGGGCYQPLAKVKYQQTTALNNM